MLPATAKLIIEQIMELSELNLEELAKRLKISRQTLHRIRLGYRASLTTDRSIINFYLYLLRMTKQSQGKK